VIATYNAADTIQRCLNSIIKQKTKDIELIVIDGGSTDETQYLLSKNVSSIDFLISEKDAGIYDAWNKGISNSSGQWILFIGADDILESDAINIYLSFLRNNDVKNIDYICAKNKYVTGNGEVIKKYGVPWNWNSFRFHMSIAHVASLHSKTLFENVGIFDTSFKITGDYELLLRKKENLKCLFIDNYIAQMTIGGTSYSVKALIEAFKSRRLHSNLPIIILLLLFLWQLILYYRHKIFISAY
jgi:glycosyltransferase involved in cell wall biosynthesis